MVPAEETDMHRTTTVLAAAGILLLAGTGLGGASSTALDEMESFLEDTRTAIGEPGDREEKRRAKSLDRALRGFAKGSTTLKGDIAIAKKAVKAVARTFAGDDAFDAAFNGSLEALEGELRDSVSGLGDVLEPLGGSRKVDRALAGLGTADALLDEAGRAEDHAARVRLLGKAERQTRRAQKVAANPPPPPGGGSCPAGFRSLGAGEMGLATTDAGGLAATCVDADYATSVAETTLTVILSEGSGEAVYLLLEDPGPGTFDAVVAATRTAAGWRPAAGPFAFGSGTITVTEFDLGTETIAGTFAFTTISGTVSGGSFRVVGWEGP